MGIRTVLRACVAPLTIALLAGAAPPAAAQSLPEVLTEGAREQSCRAIAASTVGVPDEIAADAPGGPPASWPAAPAGTALPPQVVLRTRTASFNRLFEFALHGGTLFTRRRGDDGPWRAVPVPACFAGRVDSISVDDDELVALDDAQRVYTMDNALKDPLLWNWSARWGTPVWLGPGYALPGGVLAWSWSVISKVEDGSWTDPAGNRTPIGDGKVSHIWGLRTGGQRLTFWDPWLPLDEAYEACGPHRGRFRAVNLSASGSHLFVIGAHGDLFTRLYDFDISGHDPVFFRYAYEDQRGKGDGAPIQLPAEPWRRQPKIPGEITSAISIHKIGTGAIHRILRVEGRREGRTGYWERDLAAPAAAGWTFHATGEPLTRPLLDNPARDTSTLDLGPGEDRRYVMDGPGLSGEIEDFSVYCSPARLRLREADGTTRELTLHHVDGLRQQPRGRGLDDLPRTQPGAIESPGGRFELVTVRATLDEIVVEEKGWRFRHAGPQPLRAARCLPRELAAGTGGIGPVALGVPLTAVLEELPVPVRRTATGVRWCVDGGGALGAALTRGGRVALVRSTAPGHGPVAGVRPGSRSSGARRAFPRRVGAIGRDLVRTTRAGRRVVELRGGRVRAVAVATRGAARTRTTLRTALRAAR